MLLRLTRNGMKGGGAASGQAARGIGAGLARTVPVTGEPLEPRRLLSAGVDYLAPSTLAGGTLTATTVAPLGAAGTTTFLPDHGSTLTGTAPSGASFDDTYAYQRINVNTGVLHYIDAPTGITYADTLSFASGTAGTFSAVPIGSAGPTQTGTFTFAPVAQPFGADLIASFLKVPNGLTGLLAGESTTLVVNIANVGSAGGAGFVTVNFYWSANGLPGGAISLGAAGRVTALGLQYSADIGRIVTFPQSLATGSYFLVATLTPSANFSDVDHSNDIAVSAIPIQITGPGTGGSSPSVTLTSSIVGLDPGTLRGGKLTLVFLTLTSNVDFEGDVPVNLLVTPSAGGDATVVSAFEKKIAFAAGQSEPFPVRVVAPDALTTGDYLLTAQVGPSATKLASTQQIVTTASSPLSSPVAVTVTQPPVATLTASIVSLPATVPANELLNASLLLDNTGTAAASGQYKLLVFAAPIGNPNAIKSIPLMAIPLQLLRLAPGESQSVAVTVPVPKSLKVLAPNYSLVVVVDTVDILNITSTSVTATSAQVFAVT
jgi:hypothetical protein